MEKIKLMIEKDGEVYLVEKPMPNMSGYRGYMSMYSLLQSTVDLMLRRACKDIDDAETEADERNGMLGAK